MKNGFRILKDFNLNLLESYKLIAETYKELHNLKNCGVKKIPVTKKLNLSGDINFNKWMIEY